jgi:apolipoprotein N-acyltransferase
MNLRESGKARGVWLRLVAVLVSAVLVALAFPVSSSPSSADGPVAAWFGLVPLLLLALRSSGRSAFWWGWLCGGVMNAITLAWLLRLGRTFGLWPLMVLGWLALAVYCGLYWGLFAWAVSDLWRRLNARMGSARLCGIVMILLVPLFWVGLEYLRGKLFTGFPWNQLGASQYGNMVVLRVATLGGVYAVSAVLVIMNMALAAMANRAIDAAHRMAGRRRFNVELALGLLTCAICWSWGVMDLRRVHADRPIGHVRMTLVQPNLRLMGRTDSASNRDHFRVILEQLDLAAFTRPDVLILPETAIPTVLRYDGYTRRTLAEVVGQTPLLTGCLDAASEVDYQDNRLYNAALLLREDEIIGAYRKQHLVPFGEYLPFVKWLPFDVPDPLGFDCVAGDGPALMSLPVVTGGETQSVSLAVLICFEDAFASVADAAVEAGAKVLVNLTNDGWFENSGAARQHMAQSVLRAVEQGVPVVRCANTGVSCVVDRDGRVPAVMADETGNHEIRNFRPYNVPVYSRAGNTPYAIIGDRGFALPAALLTLGFLLVGYCEYRKNGRRCNRPQAVEPSDG